MNELQQTNLEKTLLAWCRQTVQVEINQTFLPIRSYFSKSIFFHSHKCFIHRLQSYEGVDIKNFTTSWSNGLAFNALLHRWRPDLFDFNAIARKHPNARLDHAFRLAQEQLGIERLLDPEGIILFYLFISR